MAQKDYYSINKIVDIINCYHRNMGTIKELDRDMKSVGVSQYGIESSLPKGNTISSVVENEAIRQIENTKFWAETITDMHYIQDRWHRITDEKDAAILNLKLNGYHVREISRIMKMDRSNVYKIIRKIARDIKSYPQDVATLATNLEEK